MAQPFYCTEAGNFYGRAHFATARTDKDSYILFYTLSGSGLIEQNDQRIELPAGSALLLNCRTPQSYCTAPGQDHWHHYWVHLDGAGVANLAEVLLPLGRLSAVPVSRLEMQPLFESLTSEWEHGTTAAQIETGLLLHRMLALMARQLLAGDESRSNRTLIEHAAEFIRQHYAEPLSLDRLLAQTPVSKSWFLRLFRQYMGTTPYNFFVVHTHHPRQGAAGADGFFHQRDRASGRLRGREQFLDPLCRHGGAKPPAVPQKCDEARRGRVTAL